MRISLAMTKTLKTFACCIAVLVATSLTYAKTTGTSARETVPVEKEIVPAKKRSALIVIRDASGKNAFAKIIPTARGIFAEQLSEAQIETIDDSILSAQQKTTVPAADLAGIFGADYVLVATFSAPHAETRVATLNGEPVKNKFITFPATLSIALPDGKTLATRTKSYRYGISATATEKNDIDALTEMFAQKAIVEIAQNFAKMIIEKKINEQKLDAVSQSTTVSLSLIVPAMQFPQIVEDNGKFSLASQSVPAQLGGINVNINGIDYPLNATGTPTQIALPRNRLVAIKISHPDIVPVERTVRIQGEKQSLDFSLQLSEDARKRWLADAGAINALVEQIKSSKRADALTEGEVALLKGKAVFWSNSKMNFNFLHSRKETHSIEEIASSMPEKLETEKPEKSEKPEKQ